MRDKTFYFCKMLKLHRSSNTYMTHIYTNHKFVCTSMYVLRIYVCAITHNVQSQTNFTISSQNKKLIKKRISVKSNIKKMYNSDNIILH